MSTKKATKRALLTSILAICLCLVMLIGSTFAWFTDTASTNVNKIESGTLKVALEMKNPEYTEGNGKPEWISAEGQTLQFLVEGKVPAKNEDGTLATILWEPGCTYELQPVRVRNDGNLALKYKVEITGIEANRTPVEGQFNLNDVIEWTIVTGDDDNNAAVDKDNNVLPGEYFLLPADTVSAPLTIKGHMKEEAGNDYQGLSIQNVAITVYATQYTYESDSNDKWYDANAQYPDVAYVTVPAPAEGDETNQLADALISAATADEAKDKIAAKLDAGTYTLTDRESETRDKTKDKEIALIGAGAENTTFSVEKENVSNENNGTYCFDGTKSVVLKDMTIRFNSGDYRGFNRVGNIRIENCTIVGMASEWATGNVEFSNCKFVFPEDTNEWNNYTYNLWTRTGSSFTFNNCTFTSENGKFINVYREGNDGVVDVTLNKCKFINNGNAKKAAVLVKGAKAWNVTITDCKLEGNFDEFDKDDGSSYDANGLWLIENAAVGNKITVNGTVVFSK